jgi:glutathione peroxidase
VLRNRPAARVLASTDNTSARATLRSRGKRLPPQPRRSTSGADMTTIYDFSAKTIDGDEQALAAYRGKTMLIVNVASKCGFTPQYTGLEELHEKFEGQGLVVLGFPCDQFGHQEPGDEAEIKNFCALNYDVKFPLFAKIEVNGANAHPLYKYLKHEAKGLLGSEAIKWNFTKFLVDAQGKVVKRYAPTDTPQAIGKELESKLAQARS